MKVTARNILSGTRQKFFFYELHGVSSFEERLECGTMLRSAGLGNCDAVIPMVWAGLL
jgi:hypothetical protein